MDAFVLGDLLVCGGEMDCVSIEYSTPLYWNVIYVYNIKCPFYAIAHLPKGSRHRLGFVSIIFALGC